jgi:two-component system NtrC family sensor kinase
MLRTVPVTGWRLGGAFCAVLALFAAALLVMLQTLSSLESAEREVATLEEAKHAGHYAAAFVREQYIHQAHTIISGNDSHLGHYDEVVRKTDAAVRRVMDFARTPQQRAWAAEIANLAHESDTEFRRSIVPAILRGDFSSVQQLHDRMEAMVTRVVEINEQLNRDFEQLSDDARGREVTLRVHARNVVILCFTLAIAISAILAILIMRSILRPIARLRAGAAEIAKGRLDTRIPVVADDEFGELSVALNQMASDLADRERDLVRSRTLATVGRMAASIAHEINNPLSVILGYTRILQKQQSANPEISESLEIIESETRQCRRIVEELLDLTRPPKIEHNEVDLVEVVRDAVERLHDGGTLDGVRISGPGSVGNTRVWGDETKLRQVVSNLLVNAAEATSPGGEIEISVNPGTEGVSLTIADAGEGISPDVLPHVFGPFFTTKPKGTGLGLAICQTITHAHGGTIDVKSEPDLGTRVTVYLPRGASQTRVTAS